MYVHLLQSLNNNKRRVQAPKHSSKQTYIQTLTTKIQKIYEDNNNNYYYYCYDAPVDDDDMTTTINEDGVNMKSCVRVSEGGLQ